MAHAGSPTAIQPTAYLGASPRCPTPACFSCPATYVTAATARHTFSTVDRASTTACVSPAGPASSDAASSLRQPIMAAACIAAASAGPIAGPSTAACAAVRHQASSYASSSAIAAARCASCVSSGSGGPSQPGVAAADAAICPATCACAQRLAIAAADAAAYRSCIQAAAGAATRLTIDSARAHPSPRCIRGDHALVCSKLLLKSAHCKIYHAVRICAVTVL